ncbi:universal stress protein [Yunchengibacter salinarum]|uniref:universal stress protein n=1 Tax=Yunchengibacter salinarum TaxID=3133399 RepID=UPI0035B58A7B
MLKSLLVPMTGQTLPDSADAKARDGAVEVALALTRRYRATLTGLFIRPDPRTAIPFMGEGLTADMVQELCDAAEQEGRQQASRGLAVFRAACERAGLPLDKVKGDNGTPAAHWDEVTGLITDHVGRRARLADLSICHQPSDGDGDQDAIFSDLLFRSGRSLLMVPGGMDSVGAGDVGRTVMVAWNGRAECARAVNAALPVLAEAAKVHLVQVGDIDSARPGLGDARDYLALHAIPVSDHKVARDGAPVADRLIAEADRLGADMVVIGAYSHARWREMILGGVTRDLVADCPLPIFMAH